MNFLLSNSVECVLNLKNNLWELLLIDTNRGRFLILQTHSNRLNIAGKFIRLINKISPIQRALLFGSTARTEDKWESDIDIALIISRKLTSNEIEKINESVTQILLNTEMVINWMTLLNEEWDANALPIVQTIHKEGQILWERKKTG